MRFRSKILIIFILVICVVGLAVLYLRWEVASGGSLRAFVRDSEVILQGEVISSEIRKEGTVPFTFVTFRPIRVFKGHPTSDMPIVRGYALYMNRGEDYLLFLHPLNNSGKYVLEEEVIGKWKVEEDPAKGVIAIGTDPRNTIIDYLVMPADKNFLELLARSEKRDLLLSELISKMGYKP